MSSDTILRQALMAVWPTLPLVGDVTSGNELRLSHYSEDPAITSFVATDKFSWTQQTPSDPDQIATFTGKYSLRFRAIYLIRLGIGAAYKPGTWNGGGGFVEYAINRALSAAEFGKVPITYDPTIRRYVP